jgi:DNA-binding HxlR family transcriptional regulator
VLRDAFYGIRRFDEFQRGLGIARNTLTDRLRRLVDEGLLEKHAYQQDPVRYDYVLTDKGQDFFGVVAAMMAWGDRWLADAAGPPITLHHARCGHDAEAQVVCDHCKQPLRPGETAMQMGPGYPTKLGRRPDVISRFAADA